MSDPQLDYTTLPATPHRVDPRRFWNVLTLWLTFAPIVLATVASIVVSMWSMGYRLRMPYPQNPWESAIVADAWRFAHGMKVYERIPEGHATHFYGPLTSYTLGAIYKIAGAANLYTGRIVTLASALLTCVILLWIFTSRRYPLTFFVAVGLLLSLHYRGRAYFVETRPDMIALLFATLSLVVFYHAHVRGAPWFCLPGVALVLIAMLFKQTYAAAAAVPALAVLISHDWIHTDWRDLRRQMILALIPLFAVGATIILMKRFTPIVYSYVIEEPAMYEVRIERLGLATLSLITLSPLFVALALWYVVMPRDPLMRLPKVRWLIAAVIAGSAASIPVFAKRGGTYNSLLLGWVPMTAFCVVMMNPLLRRLGSLRGELMGVGGGWLVALLIAITTFAVPNSQLWNFAGAHGDSEYVNVVEAVHQMKLANGRTVVCPDDPTIIMNARNLICRSLEAELDATGRPGGVPEGLANEIAHADWMIRVHGNHDGGFFTPEMMANLGFERQKNSGSFRRIYSLWKRVSLPTTQATSAPVRPKRRGQYTP